MIHSERKLIDSCNFCPFGVQKKSECKSESDHTRFFFLKPHSHTHTSDPSVMRSCSHAVSKLLTSDFSLLTFPATLLLSSEAFAKGDLILKPVFGMDSPKDFPLDDGKVAYPDYINDLKYVWICNQHPVQPLLPDRKSAQTGKASL